METAQKSRYYLSKIKLLLLNKYWIPMVGIIIFGIFVALIITIIFFVISDWDMILNDSAYRKQLFDDFSFYWLSFFGLPLLWGITISIITVIFDMPTSYRGKTSTTPAGSKAFLLGILVFPFFVLLLIYFVLMYIFYRTVRK